MQVGDILNGTYRIVEPLNASGGFGLIYLGYHENLRKYVVIKKIKSQVVSLVNCRIEVDILKSLHHQYLPQVYDFVENTEGIFTVMDYIPGHDLKYYQEQGYVFDDAQLIFWLRQLCEVLNYLHTRTPKIIHCDIKPGNIMVTESGDICLIDFNISLDGENNKDLVGVSSKFAAPEQMRKAKQKMQGLDHSGIILDERTDIYSLGTVFYNLMSGLNPVIRREQGWTLRSMELDYDSALVNIIDKCMAYEPAKRFQNAAQILDALDHQQRWTNEWLKKNKIARISVCAGIFVAAACICVGIGVSRAHRRADFFEDYDALVDAADVLSEPLADASDYETILNKGAALLNTNRYESLMEAHEAEHADVFYLMGQAALLDEDPVSAEQYLKEAVSIDDTRSEIYRDLALACAQNEKLSYAVMYLEEAETRGLSEAASSLIHAQMAAVSGEWQSAYDLAVAAASGSSDSNDMETLRQSAVLAVTASEQLGNYGECMRLTKQLYENIRSSGRYIWLEKCGELCVMAVEAAEGGEDSSGLTAGPSGTSSAKSNAGSGSSAQTETYLEEGVSCYETLKSSGYADLDAVNNLVYLYEKQGDLISARDLLKELIDLYPDEYTVPMELAYIYYRIENAKGAAGRDYANVKYYYEMAVDVCAGQGIDASQDESMVALESIMAQLKENGWISQ